MLIPWSRSMFAISFGGQTVTDRVMAYLLSVEVVDKAGSTADTCRIVLDDGVAGQGRFEIPEKGTPMTVSLGSTGRGVVERFTGFVEKPTSQLSRGGGLLLDITGKSMDSTSGIKEPKQKHADEKPLSAVASEFATAGGLSGIDVHSSLASITRPYWAMDGESVIAWGRRIANEVGGTFKVIGTKGVIVPRSAGISASGKPLQTIIAARGANLITAEISPQNARPEFGRFVGRYYDPKQAKWLEKEITLTGGGGSSGGTPRRQTLSMSKPDVGEAEHAGTGESKDSEREKGGGTIEIDGDPMALAEATCQLVGVRSGVDGSYTIETVTDRIDRSRGYVTRLDVVRPQVGG